MNKKSSSARFLIRWFVGSSGLWLASELLGSSSVSVGEGFSSLLIAGFILAVVNTFVRPLVVFLTLPAVLVTLGIFMVVINALMVLLVSWLYPTLSVDGFGIALIVGLIIGILNWLVSAFFEDK